MGDSHRPHLSPLQGSLKPFGLSLSKPCPFLRPHSEEGQPPSTACQRQSLRTGFDKLRANGRGGPFRIKATLALAALTLATPASAQTVTAIIPDAPGNPLATGTQVNTAGTVTTIDGGTRSGANLFHSFSNFDLAAGETARWVQTTSDPTTIANVINRVTGGSVSHIDGTLNSTALSNAAFYFINPAGIVFGAGAQVNVPASAFFSTGQNVRFADGATFSATTPGGSTLSAAPVASFGFLGGQGAIGAAGNGGLFVGRPTVTLAASDITLDTVTVATSALTLVAVGTGAASVDPRSPPGGLTGAVTLTDSAVTARPGDGDGSIRVAGGSVAIDDSLLGSTTTSDSSLGDLVITAPSIAITNFSQVSSITNGTGNAGNAGNVLLTGRSILIDNASLLSRTGTTATGLGGLLSLTADSLTVRNNSQISANTLGPGAAGNVALIADSATIADSLITGNANAGSTGAGGMVGITARLLNASGSTLSANTFGAGAAGNVTIAADSATIGSSLVVSNANAGSTGAGGTVTVNARLLAGTFSTISANTFAMGNAGSVTVAATGAIALDSTYIATNANVGSTGNAGSIVVQAPVLTMANDSRITSNSFAVGNAGTIGVAVPDLRLDNSKIITNANPGSTGNAGTISIAGSALSLANFSAIASSTQGTGTAGAVLLQTSDLTMSGVSAIRSSQQIGGTGDAGRIAIAATGTVRLTDFAVIESGTVGPGNAGIITVGADRLVLDNALIGTDAFAGSSGNAGSVTVTANAIAATNLGWIRSSTVGAGNAGSVAVTVENGAILLDTGSLIGSDALFASTGNAGTVSVSARSLTVGQGAFVSSDAVGSGNAGTVTVKAASTIVDGGSISSQAYPNTIGNAGTVAISGGTILVRNGGEIASSTYGSGNAGAVDLKGTSLTLASGGSVSTLTAASGRAGSVSLDFGTITLDGGAVISSSALDRRVGTSGSVAIRADRLALAGVAQIQTQSSNINPAGSVDVTATDLRLTGVGSEISTANIYPNPAAPGVAQSAYAAGAVRIAATYLTIRDGASITSNSLVGPAGDLTITMPFKAGLILLSSAGTPSTITTSSGPGTGGRITIATPLAVISNGGEILAKGAQRGANVLIASNYFVRSADRTNRNDVDGAFKLDSNIYDVSSGTAVPSLEYLDASRVLSGQCASARARGVTSRLSARATGPYAVAPNDPAPAAPGGCQ